MIASKRISILAVVIVVVIGSDVNLLGSIFVINELIGNVTHPEMVERKRYAPNYNYFVIITFKYYVWRIPCSPFLFCIFMSNPI